MQPQGMRGGTTGLALEVEADYQVSKCGHLDIDGITVGDNAGMKDEGALPAEADLAGRTVVTFGPLGEGGAAVLGRADMGRHSDTDDAQTPLLYMSAATGHGQPRWSTPHQAT